MVAGAAPRLAAARCTGLPARERFLDDGIASHPLFLASTRGGVLRLKKTSQLARSSMKPPPPQGTPQSVCSATVNLSRKLAKEVMKLARHLMQCIQHMRIQLDMKNLRDIYHKWIEWMRTWLETKNVQARIRLTILDTCLDVLLATFNATRTEGRPLSKSDYEEFLFDCAKSNFEAQQASDSTTTQPSPEEQPEILWSKAVKSVKKSVNKTARKILWMLVKEDWLRFQKEIRWKAIRSPMFCLAFLICLVAYKEAATISERAAAYQMLAVECKELVFGYNLPEKLLQVGHFVCSKGMKVAELCKQAERSYKLYDKLLVVWKKAQEAGKLAENVASIWVNIEKLYQIFENVTKGAKNP